MYNDVLKFKKEQLEFEKFCSKRTEVAQRLAERFRKNGYDCPDAQSWAIWVVITGPWKLSVSVYRSETSIETALVKNNKLVYIKNLGYSDVRYFEKFDEVVKEIERLKKELQSRHVDADTNADADGGVSKDRPE